MNLSSLTPAKGSVKNSKRIGRGQGSGRGGTSTRGHKGAKSRSGYSKKLGFEGGQMPLQRRVPKFGFTSRNRLSYAVVSLGDLQELATKLGVTSIDVTILIDNGFVGKSDKVKILSNGELSSKIEIKAHAFSKSATAAIEKVGGTTEIVK